jgi:hypothetical protein
MTAPSFQHAEVPQQPVQPPVQQPSVEQSPFESSPFERGDAGFGDVEAMDAVPMDAVAAEVEEDPFGHVAVVDEEPAADDTEDLFGSPGVELHDGNAERQELEAMLANARGLVASLEAALERARENERLLTLRLQR